MNKRITLLNSISSLLLQISSILTGLIIPQIVLRYFGSGINGLVSSINQFLSHISLIEGGITGVIAANLYKPLVNGDSNMVSSILCTAKRFYKRIGLFFVIYTISIAIGYPIIFKLEFFFTFFLVWILSINLFVQYMFSLTYRTLLNADKKVYVVSFVQIAINIANIALAYFSIIIYPSIHLLKLFSGVAFVLQPLFFSTYVKKNYNIMWNVDPDNNLIKERWNGFAINVAAFVHNCTDITVLTFFSDFKTVSVYSVYALITNGIKRLIMSITTGINPTIGHAYAKGSADDLREKLDLYEYIVFFLTCFLFSLVGLLITPFVMLYTSHVNDAPYYQPVFGMLIVISEALYLIKFPHLHLSYAANKFKELTVPAYTEAVLNIIVSIVLVKKLGLIGVIIGTIVAMVYRLVFHVSFSAKIMPERKQIIFYRKLFIFIITSFIGIIICYIILPFGELSILNWIIKAIVYVIVMGLSLFIMSLVCFRNEMRYFVNYLRLKKDNTLYG